MNVRPVQGMRILFCQWCTLVDGQQWATDTGELNNGAVWLNMRILSIHRGRSDTYMASGRSCPVAGSRSLRKK
jgi:hypothetical protein